MGKDPDLGAPNQPVKEEEVIPQPPGASGSDTLKNQLQWSRIKKKLSYVKPLVELNYIEPLSHYSHQPRMWDLQRKEIVRMHRHRSRFDSMGKHGTGQKKFLQLYD
ncbi:hypothetical protein Salat_0518500 [Sesamum alatum]|uniref:Uncharacterized protein n=1 Tax=Sesamum alatum TaxID=300844 RepID=A0AAE1Z4M8_9LAMI|nr:hypothetical protein Salat_0518500 [Sesamum alatum]